MEQNFDESFSKSGKRCSVPGCGRRGCSMFLFPTETRMREQWRTAARITRNITNTMYICALHFPSEAVYKSGKGRTRLKKDAVPSKHLPEEDYRKPGPRHCAVPQCGKSSSDNVSIHQFPRNELKRLEWAKLCALPKTPTRNSLICSSHFLDIDFIVEGNRRSLKSSAVPALLLPGKVTETVNILSDVDKNSDSPVNNNKTDSDNIKSCDLEQVAIDQFVMSPEEESQTLRTPLGSEGTSGCLSSNSKDHDSGAGPSNKKRRSTSYCCVPGCSNYRTPDLSFHLFPGDKNKKKEWETILRLGREASAHMRVCCEHFLPTDFFPRAVGSKKHILFPHAIPSQKLPKTKRGRAGSPPQKQCKQEGQQQALRRLQEKRNYGDPHDIPPDEYNDIDSDSDIDMPSFEGPSLSDYVSEYCNTLQEKPEKAIQVAMDQGEYSRTSYKPKYEIMKLTELISSNEKLLAHTGIHSLDLLKALVDCASDLAVVALTKEKTLSVQDRIILTMLKIKQNMRFTTLSILFGVTRQVCSNYFKNMCPILARILTVMIPWPQQEEIEQNSPTPIRYFKNCETIVDCAETVIENCNCLKCRVFTNLEYKTYHTAKFLVGVTPSGLITKISSVLDGGASDKLTVNTKRDVYKLNVNSGVTVDKGFRTEGECLERHLKLMRPPFLKESLQLPREHALETAENARAPTHIDRVIQRLRNFELLQGPIPWELAPYFIDCLLIAGGLINLSHQQPVINID